MIHLIKTKTNQIFHVQLKYNLKQIKYGTDQPMHRESNHMRAIEARQPCLQKRAYGEVFAITARAKGDSPLTPSAARLPAQALGQRPADGWTRAMPTQNH